MSLKRIAAVLALIGLALAVPVKQHQPRRHHGRAVAVAVAASDQDGLLASVSTPQALKTRFEGLRGTGGPIDASSLKPGKHTRHRRPKFSEETKLAVFPVGVTEHRITPVSPTKVRRSNAPLNAFGSGLCYSLPRPREGLITPSSLCGTPAV